MTSAFLIARVHVLILHTCIHRHVCGTDSKRNASRAFISLLLGKRLKCGNAEMQKIPYWWTSCDGRLNSASHPSRFKMASWGMKKWRPYKKKKKTRAALHTRSLRPQSVKTPPCALSCQWQRLKSHSVSLTDSVTFPSQHCNVDSEHRLNDAARRGEHNYFLIRQFPESGAKQTYYTHDALLKKEIIYIYRKTYI